MSYLLWHYLTDSVARDPSRPAVVSREAVLTYGELDVVSDRVARALADAGIGRGSRVGLCLPKSDRAVAAMLGALKAGAAYIPVDPAAPPRRGAFILRDGGVRALVSTIRNLHDYRDALPELTALDLVILTDEQVSQPTTARPRVLAWSDLPDASPVRLSPRSIESDPAYLLYTSGSTGHPKGVILSHRHALTFVDWAVATFGIRPEDRLSNHAPLHFDLSVFDIYAALSAGACVAMVPDDTAAFPMELARWIDTQAISVWYSVPSALVRLLLHGKMERFSYPKLRTVLFAGEVFPIKYLREIMARLPHTAFSNLYGPTETNVCTFYRVPPSLPADATEIPIGEACANTDVFVLDQEGQEVRPGGTGELYVRGPAVMLGYWRLADRTRASLVPNASQSAYQEPVYRTGDLVRLGSDGFYYFIGRRDHMVKSRGYRIELGEIEQVLHQHPQVREAAVVAVPDDEVGARLHAVVAQTGDGRPTERDLDAFCATRLPRYMIPESFLVRDELPKTSSGKIDRVALHNDLCPPPQEASTP